MKVWIEKDSSADGFWVYNTDVNGNVNKAAFCYTWPTAHSIMEKLLEQNPWAVIDLDSRHVVGIYRGIHGKERALRAMEIAEERSTSLGRRGGRYIIAQEPSGTEHMDWWQ